MRAASVIGILGVWCVVSPVRADMLPDGAKGVRLAIQVEARPPAGKVLVLANTFRGADIIMPGVEQEIEWHPMSGKMQLRVLAADRASELGKLASAGQTDKVLALVGSASACGPAFDGVRTIDDSLLTDKIRWQYAVEFRGSGCSAKLLRTEHLDASGKQVDPDAKGPTAADMLAPPAPAAPASPPAPASPVAPASPATPASQAAPANHSAPVAPASPAASEARSGCAIGEVGGLWVVVLAGLWRRGARRKLL